MGDGRKNKAERGRGFSCAAHIAIPATLFTVLAPGVALAQAAEPADDSGLVLLSALAAGVAGCAFGVFALRRARSAAMEAGRAARDLDAVSRRLIELENRFGQELASDRSQPEADRTDKGTDEHDLFVATQNELTVEIGLLGGLVKDIADTVADHDRTLETLAADIGTLRRDIAIETARHASAPSPLRAAPEIQIPATSAPMPAPGTPQGPGPVASTAARVPTPPVAPAPSAPPVLPEARKEQTSVPARPAAMSGSAAPAQMEPSSPAQGPAPATEAAPPVRPVARGMNQGEAGQAQHELAILAAAAADNIELHLQAVVGLPQRRVRFYEALSRLRLADGQLLTPAEFLPVLERRGKATRFDEAAIARVLQVARHLAQRDAAAAVSFNLGAASIAEPGYLRGLDRVFAGWPDIAGRIILEIPQRVFQSLDLERLGALAAMNGRGVRLCIDRASDLRIDPGMLAERGVSYLKLPASLLLGEEAQRADIHIADLAALLARAGITLIAEKVESEDVVRELLDLDVSLAQGFLFSMPRPVRAEVLAGMAGQPGDPPPPAADAPPAPAGAQERRPFRDFLRRA